MKTSKRVVLDEVCGKQAENLKQTCKECSKTFSKYSNLKKHEESHKPQVVCEKRLKSFPTKYKYNEHSKNCSTDPMPYHPHSQNYCHLRLP